MVLQDRSKKHERMTFITTIEQKTLNGYLTLTKPTTWQKRDFLRIYRRLMTGKNKSVHYEESVIDVLFEKAVKNYIELNNESISSI